MSLREILAFCKTEEEKSNAFHKHHSAFEREMEKVCTARNLADIEHFRAEMSGSAFDTPEEFILPPEAELRFD